MKDFPFSGFLQKFNLISTEEHVQCKKPNINKCRIDKMKVTLTQLVVLTMLAILLDFPWKY